MRNIICILLFICINCVALEKKTFEAFLLREEPFGSSIIQNFVLGYYYQPSLQILLSAGQSMTETRYKDSAKDIHSYDTSAYGIGVRYHLHDYWENGLYFGIYFNNSYFYENNTIFSVLYQYRKNLFNSTYLGLGYKMNLTFGNLYIEYVLPINIYPDKVKINDYLTINGITDPKISGGFSIAF